MDGKGRNQYLKETEENDIHFWFGGEGTVNIFTPIFGEIEA